MERPEYRVRLLLEQFPYSGAWNMAVDEVLLESAMQDNVASLRLYRWREATVSLGYFQKPDRHPIPTNLQPLPLVRRLSGGGAILHHHEWTYSCAVPADHPLARDPGMLYDAVHGQMIATLREVGVHAELRGVAAKRDVEPFLCFGRGDPRDIVCGGTKIVGSAQRRRRGAILQHGSLLLRHSEFAPEVVGLFDLLPQASLPNDFHESLGVALAEPLGLERQEESLSPAELSQAERLELSKYSHIDWGRVRTQSLEP